MERGGFFDSQKISFYGGMVEVERFGGALTGKIDFKKFYKGFTCLDNMFYNLCFKIPVKLKHQN